MKNVSERELWNAVLALHDKLARNKEEILGEYLSHLRQIQDRQSMENPQILAIHQSIAKLLKQNHTLHDLRVKGCVDSAFFQSQSNVIQQQLDAQRIQLKVKQISCYGNDSYGGMSGRDIMALAVGLYECLDFNYLDQRVKQCEYLAQGFYKAGVKGVVLPAGGHGVYINMDEFFNGKRGHETFAGQGFSIELIRRYGIRTSELGDYSMEYDLKSPEQQAEVCNVVRFAVNRSQLSREHLDYVIAAVKALYEDQETIPNMRIVRGKTLPMRYFHAFLEPYPAQ